MIQPRGNHSWPIIHHYHRCPHCGKIVESREDFSYEFGRQVKHLECKHCHQTFVLEKPKNIALGPLLEDRE